MNNFAVIDIAYLYFDNCVRILITTNTPCHLTLYYTDKKPGRHETSRTDRGLTLPWGAYFCFVAWQEGEQTEPGDTLIHTFEICDWYICQTKWFAFRGTVAGELSPSVSPIFKHHKSWIGATIIFESTPADGSPWNYDSRGYLWAHNAAVGDGVSSVGQPSTMLGQYRPGETAYGIYRAGLFFDTSILPDDFVPKSAYLALYGHEDQSATDFDITIVSGADLHEPMIKEDYGYLLGQTASLGKLNTAGFSTTHYNDIELNAQGIEAISKTGLTKLALRSSRDIDSIPPPELWLNEYVLIKIYESGPATRPKLVVKG